MLASLDAHARRISRIAAIIAGTLILTSALIVFVDITMRRFLGWTIGGADELSGYALAIGTVWALPYCLLWRTNIRVDSLYRLFPEKIRAALDVLSLILFGAFVLLLAYRAGLVLLETVEQNSRSVSPLSVPLIYPQSIWVAGLVFYVATFALNIVRTVSAWFRGDLMTVTMLAGSGASSADADQQSIM